MVRDDHNISAVGLMLNAHPTFNLHEKIKRAFRSPGIDVIVFRPQFWNVIEPTCKGGDAYTLETYPSSLYVDLYKTYYGQDKHILVQSSEADWQAYGIGCREREEGLGLTWYGQECLDICESGNLNEYPSNCQVGSRPVLSKAPNR